MSFTGDGTTFVGLDADIFGDGDADAQALDVYICQRIRGNQYNLNSGNRSISRALFQNGDADDADGNYQGERPYASITPSSVLTIPFRLERGLDSVTVRALVNVNDQNADGSDIDYTLLVRDQFRYPVGTAQGTWSNSASGYSIEEVTATFRGYAGEPGIGEIVLQVQSRDAGNTGSNISIDDPEALRWKGSTSGVILNQDPSPTTLAPELMYMQLDEIGLFADIFGVDDTGGKGGGDDIIFPDRSVNVSDAVRNGMTQLVDVSFRYMTYAQIRSLSVELGYEEDRFGRVGLGNLAAQQPVRGPVSITQAEAINQYDRAPKMVAFGPDDYTDSTRQQASWPTDYRLRWPISVGDAVANDIIDDTVLCIDENPTFEFVLYCIGTVETGGGVPAGRELERGSSEWIFAAEAFQFDTADSDWSTPTSLGSVSATRKIDTFPNDWRQARFLRSKTILHNYSGTTGSILAGTLSNNPENWQFACKEGQLFPEDYRLVTPVTFRLSTSLSYSDTLTPIRLKVSAQYDDNTIDGIPLLGEVTSAAQLGEALHCTVVGYSIYEIS